MSTNDDVLAFEVLGRDGMLLSLSSLFVSSLFWAGGCWFKQWANRFICIFCSVQYPQRDRQRVSSLPAHDYLSRISPTRGNDKTRL